MDQNSKYDELLNLEVDVNKTSVPSVSRPTTLDLLLDNSIKSPILSNFRTPSLEDLQPLLKCEVEKLLQQLKASPQTPVTFLNPKHVTEEQERFANVFTQKLNELQDSGLASLTAALSPAANAVDTNGLYNINLSELNTQNISHFAEMCRQARINTSPASILFYSPNCYDQSLGSVQSTSNNLVNFQTSQMENNANSDISNAINNIHHSLSKGSQKQENDIATLQLPNGLQLGITTNNASQTIFQMLGIEPLVDVKSDSKTLNNVSDSTVWPLNVQTNLNSNDSFNEDNRNAVITSPTDLNDTRPSSIENSIDQVENVPLIRSSSVSSVSSSSHANSTSKNALGSSNSKSTSLDPSEQSKMRLERKRARNRDAARKCRERKIRLIKSLEKDVYHLSEENKSLRNRLSRSRVEVERLKMFVANHLEKVCPALSGKVS